MYLTMMALAAAAQSPLPSTAFPEDVLIDMRYDCKVGSAARTKGAGKGGLAAYPAGDYVFLFPADVGLITGKAIPYLYTLDDGRTFFDRATIEQPDPALGPSFGFALRTRTGAVFAFTLRDAEAPGRARLRGMYRPADGSGAVDVEGQCRSRTGPVHVNVPDAR